MTDITEARLLAESSVIPYIRRQDVLFDADNLRPNKLARLFFDDIVMNGFVQKANKFVLNSKKIIEVTPNTGAGAAIYTGDYVYQGVSNVSPTFEAVVEAYTSGNTTLVIKTMTGNFDVSANLFVENVVTGVTTTSAAIGDVTNSNTSDIFLQNEGLICANSNVFMRVIGNSGENVLYVNENFITASIAVIAPNTLSTMSGDYGSGDLVFQTASGVRNINLATFVGRVEHYNSGTGAAIIALTPISGRLNVNTSTSNTTSRLWNASNTAAKALVATGQSLYDFAVNNILISTANVSKRVAITSHMHNSGVVANVSANTIEGTQYVYVNSTDLGIAAGNLMYFTSGTGLGQFRRVVAVVGKRVELTTPLDVAPDSNTKYSIGNHIIDENGSLSGIINIPEEANFKFRTGERVFTITDVDSVASSDFTMKASATFATGGMLNVMQRVNMTPVARPLPEFTPDNPVMPPAPVERVANPTPVQQPVTGAPRSLIPRFPIGDPIAQTFFTPKPASNKVSYGVFVTSVDLFFGAKPSVARASLQLPVSVKIAEVSNGFPTRSYLASATVKAKDVKISTSPSASNPKTITKFTFADPVYLEPDKEYALIIMSESPEYEVYIAELGGDVLGADPPQRISEQPYAGSFFRSQNSSTWTPYQNEDLMFVINKAKFNGVGSALFNLTLPPEEEMNADRLVLFNTKLSFPVGALDFKVKGIYKSNNNVDNFNYIQPQEIFSYGDLLDASNKETSANFLNTRKIALGNVNSIQVLAEFASTDEDVSPIFNTESMSIFVGEYDVNNAGMSNTIISLTNRGEGYNAFSTSGNTVHGSSNNTLNNAAQLFRETYLANNYNVGLYNITVDGGLGTGADGFAVANTSGSNTVDYIVINSVGSGYIETPSVVIADGRAVANVAAIATVQGETSKRGGNIRAKYITRQIALEDGFEAGDLKVFMDVVRPNGTDVQVYYKVLSDDDGGRFSDKSWVRMHKRVDRKSKDSNQAIALEFTPDLLENKLQYVENGQQYPIGGRFKFFAVKVCLLAADSTIVPVVTNLRIVAVPEG